MKRYYVYLKYGFLLKYVCLKHLELTTLPTYPCFIYVASLRLENPLDIYIFAFFNFMNCRSFNRNIIYMQPQILPKHFIQ